jgi:hypothetical protein
MGKKVQVYIEPDVPHGWHTGADRGTTISADLILVHIWIVLAVVTLMIPALAASLFRFIFTIPVLIFIPGYCLTAILFPGNKTISDTRRVSLSLGLSVALVSLVVLFLNASAWGIQLNLIIFFIVILTVLSGPVIQYRRSRLPREVRFRLSLFRSAGERRKREIYEEEKLTGNRTLYTIVLVLTLALLCSPAMYILNMTFPRGKEAGVLLKNGCTSHQDSTAIVPTPLITGRVVQIPPPARNETPDGMPDGRMMDNAAGPPDPGNSTDTGNVSRAGP